MFVSSSVYYSKYMDYILTNAPWEHREKNVHHFESGRMISNRKI